jgi:hypothetical protein
MGQDTRAFARLSIRTREQGEVRTWAGDLLIAFSVVATGYGAGGRTGRNCHGAGGENSWISGLGNRADWTRGWVRRPSWPFQLVPFHAWRHRALPSRCGSQASRWLDRTITRRGHGSCTYSRVSRLCQTRGLNAPTRSHNQAIYGAVISRRTRGLRLCPKTTDQMPLPEVTVMKVSTSTLL